MVDATETIKKLKELQQSGDTECAHSDADDLICELLLELGYEEVVTEYHKIDKWFA